MPWHNADVAAVLDEVADLLELEGANPFRVRAYRNAARVVRGLGREVAAMVAAGEDLTALPGIGDDLAGKLQEAVASGTTRLLKELRRRHPRGVVALLQLPGLGPKRVTALSDELGVHTVAQLARAARHGRVRRLPGFGATTERHILEALAARAATGRRFRLAVAEQYAEPLAAYLRGVPGVKRVVVAGSYRRRQETVGDLDILVTAGRGSPVVERFVAYDEVARVTARGGTRAAVVLRGRLAVDLRVVPEVSYGAALHYFTGSKAHNIAVRALGQQAGLKVNP
jgi:DNA polymerase (family 10)